MSIELAVLVVLATLDCQLLSSTVETVASSVSCSTCSRKLTKRFQVSWRTSLVNPALEVEAAVAEVVVAVDEPQTRLAMLVACQALWAAAEAALEEVTVAAAMAVVHQAMAVAPQAMVAAAAMAAAVATAAVVVVAVTETPAAVLLAQAAGGSHHQVTRPSDSSTIDSGLLSTFSFQQLFFTSTSFGIVPAGARIRHQFASKAPALHDETKLALLGTA